jgi:hypothetical protein
MTLFVILGAMALAIGFVLVGWQLDKHDERARQRGFHNRSRKPREVGPESGLPCISGRFMAEDNRCSS